MHSNKIKFRIIIFLISSHIHLHGINSSLIHLSSHPSIYSPAYPFHIHKFVSCGLSFSGNAQSCFFFSLFIHVLSIHLLSIFVLEDVLLQLLISQSANAIALLLVWRSCRNLHAIMILLKIHLHSLIHLKVDN